MTLILEFYMADEATLLEGAIEPGAHLTERDAAAALHELRQKAPPADKPAPKPAAEAPTETQTDADAPATDPAAPAADTQTQDAPAAKTDDAPTAEQAPATLSDLAAKLGTDESNLMGLKLRTKIDGEDGEVTLAQALKSYQLEGHQNRKLMELAEERKSFEKEREVEVQKIVGRQQELETALNVAAQYLHGQYARMTPEAWAKLQQEDPIGYLATKDQYEQHMRGLQGIHATLTKGQQDQLKKQQSDYHTWAQNQAKDVVNHIPEWKDAKVAQKALDGIFATAKADYGITQPELDQLIDSRYVRILKDAASWRSLQGQKTAVLKKVTDAPTIARPGSGKQSNTNPKQEAFTRFNADPSERNAAAALSALRAKKK